MRLLFISSNVGGLYPSELLPSCLSLPTSPRSKRNMETWVDAIVGCLKYELPDMIYLNMQEMGGKHKENVDVLSRPDNMLSQTLDLLCSRLTARYLSERKRLWASRLVFCTGRPCSDESRLLLWRKMRQQLNVVDAGKT